MASIKLTGDTSGEITISAPAVAGTNTLTLPAHTGTVMVDGPAFRAYQSTGQAVLNTTFTKIAFDTIAFDTASCYDTVNYRFTPNVAGKYYVALSTTVDDGAGALRQAICRIYKNGTSIALSKLNFDNSSTSEGEGGTPTCITIVDMNGSSDYLEGFVDVDTNDGGSCNIQGDGTERHSRFSAYKLIGV